MAAAALVPAMCVHHCSSHCDQVHRSASSSSSSGFASYGSFSAEALFLRGQTRVLNPGKGRFKIVVRASSSLKDGEKREPPATAPVNLNKQEQQRDATDDNSEEKNAVVTAEQENPSAEAKGDEGGGISGDTALKGTVLAGLLLLGTVGGFSAVGYYYRDQVNEFLLQFSEIIEGYGPAGYALFVAVYAGLEVLAIPAIPLTMSAGLLFGTWTGIIIVSISGTIAATVAFLIARYLARDRILKLAEGNKKFLAIDKAIGENGFRVVALLRLSPLLPFSIGNYLYGLTSVKIVPYILGSWLGMLPGTWAYVSAGAFGRALIEESESNAHGGPQQLVTLGVGLVATVLAATYVTRLAKDSVKDLE